MPGVGKQDECVEQKGDISGSAVWILSFVHKLFVSMQQNSLRPVITLQCVKLVQLPFNSYMCVCLYFDDATTISYS